MSLGTDRVRLQFNPGGNDRVQALKEEAAKFIDRCDAYSADSATGEEKRLWALAMTHAEEAAMWAVKAATTGHEHK
jgi:hypothetical protein